MKRVLALSAALLVGCATAPERPGVLVLPGSTKTFDQFRADDAACRQYASAEIRGKSTEQSAYDHSYQQCMYAKGHQVPVARSAAQRSSTTTATPPPPPPPPPGSPPPPPAGYRVN